MFERDCVVVKFHDKEKYAVGVFRGTKHECQVDCARANGLYHDVPEVNFGVFYASVYDHCVDEERRGGQSVYELIPRISL